MIAYASAFIVSTIICAICALICIIFTSYTFNQIIKNDAFNSYSADNVIHLTLLTLVVFSIQTMIGTFDPIMKLEEDENAVNTVASVSVNLFMLGRFLTTLLFVKRLQFIFKDSLIAYNNCIIRTMYGMLIAEFIFIIITSFAITINEFDEAANEWDNLLYIMAGFSFYLLDTILVIWLPYLFIRKLYELIPSNYMMKQHLNENQHNDNNNQQDNNNDKQITQHSRQTESGKYDGVQLSVNITNGDNHDNASKKEEISKIEPSNNKDSHNSNEDNNNNKKDESAKHGLSQSQSGQSQASIQSIPVMGITKEDAPVYKMNGNDYKYEQIINTATRITLLSCICCFSSILLIILSSLASNNIPARAIMDALFKGDSVINCICISLCYKWSDQVYYKICQYGHFYFKNKRMCKWCCCCPHVN
jgi:hypothetical protein